MDALPLQLKLPAYAIALCGIAVHAQDYPRKPIRAVVPFAAGGGVDIAARSVGQKLNERWGQQVVVDNRGGANGNIGADLVAHSAPDGYTWCFCSGGPMAINPALYPKLPYDAVKDFNPVIMVAPTYYLLVTHPTVPANSVRDLVQLAKAKSYKLVMASAGVGSPGHLSGEMLKTMAGIDFVHVPYRGTGPALADVLGGQASFMFSDMIAGLTHVNSGRLKLLAIATQQRVRALPNTPTLSESGVPGYDAMSWTGIFVPAGTPRRIIDKINRDVKEILKIPEVQERIANDGTAFGANTPEWVADFHKRDLAKWAAVVKASGAQPE
jgi:tripartite-type tricarboxylate transporter receptor subunit TctC